MESQLESARKPSRMIEIVINGEVHEVTASQLTFEELVKLADLSAQGEVEYSVKYSRGPHNAPSGILLPGQTVKVKKEMRFVVTATVRS